MFSEIKVLFREGSKFFILGKQNERDFVQKLVGSIIYKDRIIHEWALKAKEVTLRPGILCMNKTKSLLDAIIKSFCNVLDKPVFITNC